MLKILKIKEIMEKNCITPGEWYSSVYTSKEMQVIKRDQTDSRLKITIPEMNSLRISTSDLSSQSWKSENLKTFKIIQSEEHKDKGMNKNDKSLWDLWDTINNSTSNNASFIRRE